MPQIKGLKRFLFHKYLKRLKRSNADLYNYTNLAESEKKIIRENL